MPKLRKLIQRLMSIYSAGNCGAAGSVGRGSDEKTSGVLPATASWYGKTFCSSSYPHAGQTKPSQQKYGTVNSHAGHRVVAMVPPFECRCSGELTPTRMECHGSFRRQLSLALSRLDLMVEFEISPSNRTSKDATMVFCYSHKGPTRQREA
jgi:hypothetical protein